MLLPSLRLPFSFFPARMSLFLGFVLLVLTTSCSSNRVAFGEKGYTEKGTASYYSNKLRGNKMANGQRYRPGKRTAAHPKLPLGTTVRVTNARNGRSVKVKITDRGPHTKGRILDVSMAAAKKLDMVKSGTAKVQVKVLKPAAGK